MVVGEQGYGDTLQFIRLLQPIKIRVKDKLFWPRSSPKTARKRVKAWAVSLNDLRGTK